jgi:hypothetical protein
VPAPPPRRRFDAIDLLVLLAAAALGVAASVRYQAFVDGMTRSMGWERFAPHGFRRWRSAPVPAVALWSLALLAVRLRGPRSRLSRRPGVVPSVVVAGLLLAGLVRTIARSLSPDIPFWMSWRMRLGRPLTTLGSLLQGADSGTGFATAAAWLVLLAGGWWRPEPSWVDRAGRLLGCYWIAMWCVELWYGRAT